MSMKIDVVRKPVFWLAVTLSSSAMAYTECTYQVESVFMDTQQGDAETVWVQLQVPGGNPNVAIYKDKNNASEVLRNRLYTMALTAFTAGKKLVVRFPENNAVCTTQLAPRADFLGVRLVN